MGCSDNNLTDVLLAVSGFCKQGNRGKLNRPSCGRLIVTEFNLELIIAATVCINICQSIIIPICPVFIQLTDSAAGAIMGIHGTMLSKILQIEDIYLSELQRDCDPDLITLQDNVPT